MFHLGRTTCGPGQSGTISQTVCGANRKVDLPPPRTDDYGRSLESMTSQHTQLEQNLASSTHKFPPPIQVTTSLPFPIETPGLHAVIGALPGFCLSQCFPSSYSLIAEKCFLPITWFFIYRLMKPTTFSLTQRLAIKHTAQLEGTQPKVINCPCSVWLWLFLWLCTA